MKRKNKNNNLVRILILVLIFVSLLAVFLYLKCDREKTYKLDRDYNKFQAEDRRIKPNYVVGEIVQQLEQKAENPNYKNFNESETGISFQYPSSITKVEVIDAESEKLEKTIMVKPIIPDNIGTEFWSGISINVEDCESDCLKAINLYVNEKYGTENLEKYGIEVFEIGKESVEFADMNWIKATFMTVIGAEYSSYLATAGNKIIDITTDRDVFSTDDKIDVALGKVVQTFEIAN